YATRVQTPIGNVNGRMDSCAVYRVRYSGIYRARDSCAGNFCWSTRLGHSHCHWRTINRVGTARRAARHLYRRSSWGDSDSRVVHSSGASANSLRDCRTGIVRRVARIVRPSRGGAERNWLFRGGNRNDFGSLAFNQQTRGGRSRIASWRFGRSRSNHRNSGGTAVALAAWFWVDPVRRRFIRNRRAPQPLRLASGRENFWTRSGSSLRFATKLADT